MKANLSVNIFLIEHLMEHYISGDGFIIWGEDSDFVEVINTAQSHIQLSMTKTGLVTSMPVASKVAP